MSLVKLFSVRIILRKIACALLLTYSALYRVIFCHIKIQTTTTSVLLHFLRYTWVSCNQTFILQWMWSQQLFSRTFTDQPLPPRSLQRACFASTDGCHIRIKVDKSIKFW